MKYLTTFLKQVDIVKEKTFIIFINLFSTIVKKSKYCKKLTQKNFKMFYLLTNIQYSSIELIKF